MLWSPLGTFLVHLFTSGIRLHHLPLTCPPLTAAIYLVCLLFWEFLFLLHFFPPPVMFLPPSNPPHWWHGNHFRYLRLKLFLSEVTCSHQDNWGEPFSTASRAGLISLLPRLGPGWTISTSLASCELAPASKRDGGDEAMMDRSCLVTLKVFRMLLCFQALSLAGKALLHQATCTKTCSSVSPLVAPFNRIFHSWAVSGTISWVVDAAVQ